MEIGQVKKPGLRIHSGSKTLRFLQKFFPGIDCKKKPGLQILGRIPNKVEDAASP